MADNTWAVLRWSARSETVGHAKWAFFLLAGLRNIDASNIRRSISLAVNGLEHWLNPSLEAFLRLLHRLAIHPGGRALRNLRQTLQHSIARDVMGQRSEAEFWFAPSFRCYLFKFRFHGQLIFSLNRRPCLPLNGAHVAQEQFNAADRFPMWPALPTSEYYQSV